LEQALLAPAEEVFASFATLMVMAISIAVPASGLPPLVPSFPLVFPPLVYSLFNFCRGLLPSYTIVQWSQASFQLPLTSPLAICSDNVVICSCNRLMMAG